jgi:hypothetical protein
LDALLERLAPPASEVAVTAVANVPTVRTVVGLSTLKPEGSVAVADVPMPSKFCVYGVLVDSAICAIATGWTTVQSKAAATTLEIRNIIDPLSD